MDVQTAPEGFPVQIEIYPPSCMYLLTRNPRSRPLARDASEYHESTLALRICPTGLKVGDEVLATVFVRHSHDGGLYLKDLGLASLLRLRPPAPGCPLPHPTPFLPEPPPPIPVPLSRPV